MIGNALGVVLSRRDQGECDRVCSIVTEDLGKIAVRFSGVRRSAGKLKALAEPAVWGEYRLHFSPRSEFAKCVGGSIVSTFPGLRADLARTTAALYCCELLDRLTPEHAPCPDKYRLLCATLTALEEFPSRWLSLSFGLRLMELAGFSLREHPPRDAASVWEALHGDEPSDLVRLPFDRTAAAQARSLLESHFEIQTGRPLQTAQFRESLRAAPRREGVTA